MKKTIFTLFALGLFVTAVVGCRAEGEIDSQSPMPSIGLIR